MTPDQRLADNNYYAIIAFANGVEYLGLQEFPDLEPFPISADTDCRGTTFTLNKGESLPRAIRRKREQFKVETH